MPRSYNAFEFSVTSLFMGFFFRYIFLIFVLCPFSGYASHDSDFQPGDQVFLYGRSEDVHFSETTSPQVPWLQI
jgi:hypothetical protein